MCHSLFERPQLIQVENSDFKFERENFTEMAVLAAWTRPRCMLQRSEDALGSCWYVFRWWKALYDCYTVEIQQRRNGSCAGSAAPGALLCFLQRFLWLVFGSAIA